MGESADTGEVVSRAGNRLVNLAGLPAPRAGTRCVVSRLGAQLGQRSWDRVPGRQWPRKVYPVFHAGDSPVIPDLRLGAESVPSRRQ